MARLQIVMLAVALQVASAAAQTISDRIRDARQKPGTPVVIGTLGEPYVLTLEELTRASDLILDARVSRLKSYINEADTAVFTDFAILPIRTVAGGIPSATATPGVVTPIVLTTYGGETVKDGVTVRAENHNIEELKDGVTYLLFLKRLGKDSGRYQIYNAAAFEHSDDAIRPLARHGRDLYKDFADARDGELTTRISAAAQLR